MATNPVVGAPGFRFYKDLYSTGRQGGLSYYPFSAIISGLGASWTVPSAAAPAAAPADRVVTVASGTAYLDSVVSTFAQANITVNPDRDGAVVNGINNYYIYLNPTRKLQVVLAGSGAPTTRANGDALQTGDMYVAVVDYSDYAITMGSFYKYDAVLATWTAFDPTFEAPPFSDYDGKNRIWGSECLTKATSLTCNLVEERIYNKTMYPPYVSSNSHGLLRDNASLYIANLALYYHVFPLTLYGSYSTSSTAVTLDPVSRALMAAIVAASGNANLFTLTNDDLSAAAIASGGYNAGTGVITLSANAGATASSVAITIAPATPANIYLLDPAQSELILSTNFVRQ